MASAKSIEVLSAKSIEVLGWLYSNINLLLYLFTCIVVDVKVH